MRLVLYCHCLSVTPGTMYGLDRTGFSCCTLGNAVPLLTLKGLVTKLLGKRELNTNGLFVKLFGKRVLKTNGSWVKLLGNRVLNTNGFWVKLLGKRVLKLLNTNGLLFAKTLGK